MKKLSKIKDTYWKYRDQILRKIVIKLISLSTWNAEKYLKSTEPLRVLVDSSVIANGVTHETGWISTGTSAWGPHQIDNGYAARIPVHSPQNDAELYQQIRYFYGIAQLGKRGFLKLFTSNELEAETLRQPSGRFRGYGWYDYGIFNDVKLTCVDEFHLDPIGDLKQIQLSRVNACQEPIFLELKRILGEKSSLDAFHIFTAEKFGMFCFLHVDFKLKRALEANNKNPVLRNLRTKILLPSELGTLIKLLPVHTNMLTFEGSSFPVRADLNMPDQKRRPRKAYKRES